MDINPSTLRAVYTGLSTAFNQSFQSVKPFYNMVAMTVPSTTAMNEYPRLDDLPGFREWIGDRVVHDLGGQTYVIRNKTFERRSRSAGHSSRMTRSASSRPLLPRSARMRRSSPTSSAGRCSRTATLRSAMTASISSTRTIPAIPRAVPPHRFRTSPMAPVRPGISSMTAR